MAVNKRKQAYDLKFVDKISEKVKEYKNQIESGVVQKPFFDNLPVPQPGKLQWPTLNDLQALGDKVSDDLKLEKF